MKHFALVLLAALALLGATAQTTFNVDMNCAPEGFDNVFVTGPWCGWCANDTYNTMTDPDGDGVYTVEVADLTGVVEYKYAINGFADQENLINDMVEGATCAPITDYSAYANRQIEAGSVANDYYGTCDGTCNDFPPVPGCTDAAACNYDAAAAYDDGSCTSECPGCTVSIACNYDDSATLDDGSCVFYCPGCTNADACNFDSGALQDDGSCFYPESEEFCDCDGNQLDALGVCGGTCLADADGDDICDNVDDCVGEYDECGVCNGLGEVYECGCSPLPEGSCDCNGTQFDQCGVCGGDGTSCIGCTYEFACNYDSEATILDASLCIFSTCAGCTNQDACNYNPTLLDDNGSCSWCECLESTSVFVEQELPLNYSLTVESYPAVQEGLTTYRIYVNMEDSTDHLSAVYGDDNSVLSISAPEGVHNNNLNSSWNASGLNPAFLSSFPELVDDTYATIGLTGPASTSAIPGSADPNYVEDPTQPITPFFLTDGIVGVENNTSTGCAWFILPDAANGLPDENMQVIILQITTGGVLSGTLNFQVFENGLQYQDVYRTVHFDGVGEFAQIQTVFTQEEVLLGCMDPEAVNYCEEVGYDDGTCLYEYIGCLDPGACNYSELATTDSGATCVYVQPGECDCEGNILDECGVCGGGGIPEGQCDCEGNVLDALGVCGGECESDANGNGVCDADEVGGPEACGWGTVWNVDSGACVLAVPPFLGEFGDYNTLNPCYYDLDLSGSVGAGDLINFLSTYNLATGCSWTDE